MGKKLLCLIMALCFVFGLVACGEEKIDPDKAGTDSTLLGGFVAETNDYVYFINGIESYSTEYKTGSVTKGALLRTKKSSLKDLANATYETVVSKLLVAGDTDAGFYVYGDYVYYAVSSTENDKTGNVKNDKLNFFRTKLDASNTSKNIADRDFDNGVTYRYVQSGSNVYLVVHSTELYVYDAEKCELIYTTEVNEEDYKKDEEGLEEAKLAKIDVSEVLFTGSNVYFTSNPINELLSNADNIQKDSFHVVYKVDFAGKKADKVVNGAGTKLVNGKTNPDGGFGILGVTIDLLRVADGRLYFSYTSLNSVEGSQAVYMSIPESALTTGLANTWYTNTEYVYSETTSNTASIFANTSIWHAGKVYYVQSNIGLLVYDHAKKNDPTTDKGVSVLYSSDVIMGATLDYVNVENGVNYLYFHDASNNYYKLDLNVTADSEEFRINVHAVNSSWYKPEVVKSGDKYYFIAVYSGAEFKSYVYAIDMADVKAKYDAWKASEDPDKAEDFYVVESDEDEEEVAFDVFAKQNGLLGVVADSDVEEESESTSESKK